MGHLLWGGASSEWACFYLSSWRDFAARLALTALPFALRLVYICGNKSRRIFLIPIAFCVFMVPLNFLTSESETSISRAGVPVRSQLSRYCGSHVAHGRAVKERLVSRW